MLQFLPHFWRTVLLCVLFPFSTFCLCLFSTYCLLSSKMSDKKSADILTGESLVLTIYFFLAAFKCLFTMCLCGSLSSSSLEFKELLWCLYLCLSPKQGSFQPLFLHVFSLLHAFSLLLLVCMLPMLIHFMVSQRSFRFCLLFFNLFSFCSSDSGIPLSYLRVHLFFLSPAHTYLWIPLVKFSLQLL